MYVISLHKIIIVWILSSSMKLPKHLANAASIPPVAPGIGTKQPIRKTYEDEIIACTSVNVFSQPIAFTKTNGIAYWNTNCNNCNNIPSKKIPLFLNIILAEA